MDKERAIRCVPEDMLSRLKSLADKLWEEKNPASVHLTAVLEEFDPDMKTLGTLVKEYEADYAGRLAFNEREHAQKEARLKEAADDCSERIAVVEKEHAGLLKKLEETKAALAARSAELADFKAKAAEDESALNAKYVAKMQELYDRVNRKELEMLSRWEDKNKSLEARVQAVEADYAARTQQLKLREKALEEDFKARKAELIRTFDKLRAEMDVRERSLLSREAALGKGGAV